MNQCPIKQGRVHDIYQSRILLNCVVPENIHNPLPPTPQRVFSSLTPHFRLVETTYLITLHTYLYYYIIQLSKRNSGKYLNANLHDVLVCCRCNFHLVCVTWELFINVIRHVWSLEVTSFISGNHKLSRNMFFKTAVCQMSLKFVFHQEYFNKVKCFVSAVCKWFIVNFMP